MSVKNQKVFEPLTGDKLQLKNRYSMAPHGMVAIPDFSADIHSKPSNSALSLLKVVRLDSTGITNDNFNVITWLLMPCETYSECNLENCISVVW